ncbi:MAG: BA14K family protein [Hoeflea sp.]|uniref:BA14K family protein n=1 Tax=Hoeflea sp. TaxID=1940281 RepID=UPI00329921D3|tara:strand:- start:228 stop:731 length:504 start_codon:yes stop_codon:yes gene_type:complete
MKSLTKTIGITLLTAVTAFAPMTTTASAGDRHGARNQHQSRQDLSRVYNYREYSERNQQRGNYVYRKGGNRKHNYRGRNNNNNDAIALGILGLGAAAIIGGAIANSNANNPRVIYQQPTAPRRASSGSYAPWSQSWMRYCSDKYRSFNSSTGTYRGYDGQDHFCVVN